MQKYLVLKVILVHVFGRLLAHVLISGYQRTSAYKRNNTVYCITVHTFYHNIITISSIFLNSSLIEIKIVFDILNYNLHQL